MLRCGRACACRAWSICSDMVVWGIVGHTGRGAYRRLMLSGAGRGSPRPRTGLSPLQRKWKKKVVDQILAVQRASTAAEGTRTSAESASANAGAQEELEELDEEDLAVVNRMNRIATGEEQPGPLPTVVEYSRAGFYKLWEHILYASTLNNFNLAWEKLKAFFADQTEILKYLEETYMIPSVVQEWATCYTNKRLNFGQRTTSPVESCNRYLKSFIITGNSTIFEAIMQSIKMVEEMEININEERGVQTTRIKREYLGKAWCGEAPYNLSARALSMVTKQYRTMLGAAKTTARPNPLPLPPCTGQFTDQYGIPCSHELLRRHEDGGVTLKKLDFHPF